MILVYSIQRWTTTKHWRKQSNMTRWITFIHSIDHWHMSTVCVTHVNWSTDMRRTHCPLLYCRHVMAWLQRYAVVFSRSFFSVPCTHRRQQRTARSVGTIHYIPATHRHIHLYVCAMLDCHVCCFVLRSILVYSLKTNTPVSMPTDTDTSAASGKDIKLSTSAVS